MKKQIIICCPTYENMTKQDRKEIDNLLDFKRRYKEWLNEKKHQNDKKGIDKQVNA